MRDWLCIRGMLLSGVERESPLDIYRFDLE